MTNYTTGIIGPLLAQERWHVLITAPQREARLAARLRMAGVHTAYPTETVTFRRAGKIYKREKPQVSRYVLAKFRHAPVWHEMHAQQLITGVVTKPTQWGPVPYCATEDDVRVFMGMPTVSEELEAARREALRVRPGDKAEVLGVPGLAVHVVAVDGKLVIWEAGLLRGSSHEDSVIKVAAE